MAATTVKLPVVGTVDRHRAYLIGGGAAATVVLVLWWRRRQANAAPVVDPATGQVLATDTGSYTNPNPVFDNGGTVTGEGVRTNADWSVDAQTKLVATGYDPELVSSVIGKMLAGVPLTATEMDLAQQVLAFAGQPPQGMPALRMVASGSQPGSGPPQPGPPPPTPAPKPAPQRRYVVTVAYTRTNPPWNSTLSGIANRVGRTVSQLASWNGITNVDVIGIGRRIWIDPPGTYNGSTQFNG
jgi:LysM domain-containing protein